MDLSEPLPLTNTEIMNVVNDRYHYENNSTNENNQSFNPNISAAQLDNFYSQMDSDQQSSNANKTNSESFASSQLIIKNVVNQDYVQDTVPVQSMDVATHGAEQCDQFHRSDSSDIAVAMSEIIVDKLSMDVSKKKRVCDVLRVQKVLEELSARSGVLEHVTAARYKKQKIANDARMLLLDYARELSSAILEESCLLAKHRKSKELLIPDLKLIFGTSRWKNIFSFT